MKVEISDGYINLIKRDMNPASIDEYVSLCVKKCMEDACIGGMGKDIATGLGNKSALKMSIHSCVSNRLIQETEEKKTQYLCIKANESKSGYETSIHIDSTIAKNLIGKYPNHSIFRVDRGQFVVDLGLYDGEVAQPSDLPIVEGVVMRQSTVSVLLDGPSFHYRYISEAIFNLVQRSLITGSSYEYSTKQDLEL